MTALAPLSPTIDPRRAAQLVADIAARQPGYLPAWFTAAKSADQATLWVMARYLEAILQRLNQAPEKNKLAFLDLLGIDLIPAQAARVPVIFKLSENAPDAQVPAGTRLVAPPPPESTEQIVFETERRAGLASARLREVVSLWPGRDQYIDHSAAYLTESPFYPFRKRDLQNTPHHLYIAHDTLLALAGQVRLNVEFELTQGSSEHLDIVWEYWDGKGWRGFKAMHPTCSEEEALKLDSTNGLIRSGRYLLESDCAEAKKTTVNGLEAFWIRGQLREPLPPDPAQILPEVESIKLHTLVTNPPACTNIVERRVTFEGLTTDTQFGNAAGNSPGDVIFTENGIPVSVHRFNFTGGGGTFNTCTIRAASTFGSGKLMDVNNINLKFDLGREDGTNDTVRLEFLSGGGFENISINGEPIFAGELTRAPIDIAPGVKLAVKPLQSGEGYEAILTGSVESLLIGGQEFQLDNVTIRRVRLRGFLPDQAFVDNNPLDLSKVFYPLGQQPQPGTAFYFTSEELFSKPKAKVQVFIRTASTPEQQVNVQPGTSGNTQRTPLPHTLLWEYWDGTKWVVLAPVAVESATSQPDFTQDGLFTFDIPENMGLLTVNEIEARWMRVWLAEGGYGFTARVAWTDNTSGTPNEFTYVVNQPPALADFRLCYAWQYGPFHPERVLTYNDFQYEDRTEQAKWPGNPFQPYSLVSDIIPALYLGFDKPLPVSRLNLLFDILEQGDTKGPALVWEYWDGFNWRGLSIEDETNDLRVRGLLSLIGPRDSQAWARFNAALHWVRGRLREDGPPGEPTIQQIYPNAVWVTQRQTITDEPVGTSTGRPDQVFTLRQIPILPGEQLDVRELAGPRANVEWRMLALEILGEDYQIIQTLEDMLRQEGNQTDFQQGDLRLRRDRNKRVIEVWVRWQGQKHLYFSGPNDRHYMLEHVRGRLIFGDGERGRVPPPGAAILVKRYQAGGGLVGNVTAGSITQMQGAVSGVEAVFNPIPAEGGADAERLHSLSARGPYTLRHRGRALTLSDYETLAKEASPAVAVARAIPTRDPNGQIRPGYVTLLIIPHSQAPRPWPSFGLREQVRQFIEAHIAADLAAAHGLTVAGPIYQPVDVEVTLVPTDPAQAGAVVAQAQAVLEQFLHPIQGGPKGQGWPLGRDIFLSDVASVLEAVPGVDYIEALALLSNRVLQRERVNIAADRIVVAGELRINIHLV